MKQRTILSLVIFWAAVAGLARTACADPPYLDLATAGLTAQLFDQDAAVRQACVLALRHMGPAAKTAIPTLAQVLRDPDMFVAVDASQTLDKMGPDAAIAVIPLLKDCNPRVRELAAQTLGNIGPDAKTAVPALAEALHDCNSTVRQATVVALQKMGLDAKPAIPNLAQLIRDEDRYVAVDAAHVLEKLGPEAIPSIVPLLRDEMPPSRELAAITLRQIGVQADNKPSP